MGGFSVGLSGIRFFREPQLYTGGFGMAVWLCPVLPNSKANIIRSVMVGAPGERHTEHGKEIDQPQRIFVVSVYLTFDMHVYIYLTYVKLFLSVFTFFTPSSFTFISTNSELPPFSQ